MNTPISGQRTAIEIRYASAYPRLSSRPGRKKFSAFPVFCAMNAAIATPTKPAIAN